MGRAGLAAVAALAAVFAAGCGGTATPRFGGTPSSSVPDPTTTAVSDPSPPVMPAAARAHTAAGAKAFVEFVVATLNYSQATLDEAPLRQVFSSGCSVCKAAPKTVADVRAHHGTIAGGQISASDAEVEWLHVRRVRLAHVTFTYGSTRQTIRYPGGQSKVYPAGSARTSWTLSPRMRGWIVIGWDPV